MTRIAPQPLVTRPRVSVVVPCYNYGHFLPDAVGSVLDQRDVDVDVLVVDDSSTDGSAEVARQLAAGHRRVDVLVHEENMGHIATYNDGLGRVEGDYVVLLSADDMLTPGSLGRATALMERYPNVAFTYGWAQSFVDRPPIPRTKASSWTVWPGREWLRHLYRSGRNVVTSPEVVMRRDVMARLGGYDPGLPHAADFESWMRAATLGDVGRVNGTDQAFYRAHGANMHVTEYAGMLVDLRERLACFERIDPGAPGARHGHPTLGDGARQALAREALRLGWQAIDSGGVHAGASVDEFSAFAVATWPEITRTLLWRGLQQRRQRRAGALELAAARQYRRARVHSWWLHERRVGL